MKELIIGTPSVPSSRIAVSENVNALTGQVKKHSSKVCRFKKNVHICSDLHLNRASRLAIIAAGIFYAFNLRYWFRPPCGALMRPLPDSGCRSTGKRNLYCSLPVFNQHIVSF